MNIYCCGCQKDVEARLTDGLEIYPHYPMLGGLPFWKCYTCGNYVGCHHKTADRTRPLGNIPTQELREARKAIHSLLDPMWKHKKVSRGMIYAKISKHLGHAYHTGELRTIEEARNVYRFIQGMGESKCVSRVSTER